MGDKVEAHFRTMNSPAAHRVAQWSGLLRDLEHVLKINERIAPMLGQSDVDQVLLRAYSTSATIAYARCFVSGVRSRLTPDIFATLTIPDAAGWHEYFMETRHQHVAHAGGVFDEITVCCMVDQAGGFLGIGQTMSTRTADSMEGVQMLSALATHALECVYRKIKPFNEALDAEAMAMGPARRLTLPLAATNVIRGGRPDLKVLAKEKQQKRATNRKR